MKFFTLVLVIFYCLKSAWSQEVDYKRLQKNYGEGRYEAVLKIKETGLDSEGKVFVLTYQTYAALNLNRLDTASKLLEKLKKVQGIKTNYHHLKAYLAIKKGKDKDARSELESLLKSKKISKDESLTLLNLYLQAHDFKKARRLISQMSYSEKESPEFQQIIGYLDFVQHKYKNAIYHYKKAIALKSFRPDNYLALESIYGQQKQNKKQIEVLKEGLKNNPHDFYLLSHLAYQLDISGEKYEALEYYKKALLSASEKDRGYILDSIRRLSHLNTFNSFSRYSVSDDQYVSSVQDFQTIGVESQSFQQSFEGRINKHLALGLDYIQNKQTKELVGTNQELNDKTYAIRGEINYKSLFLNLGIGRIEYDTNNLTTGQNEEDDEIIRNSLLTYKSGNNSLSFSHERKWDVDDLGSSLLVQKLDIFGIQDSYSFSPYFSLVGRANRYIARTYKLNQYGLTGVTYLQNILGLSLYVSFDQFDYENFEDFAQYFVGANYDKKWTDEFNTSFTLDIGERGYQDTSFVRLNSAFKYFFTQNHAVILGLGGTHDDSNVGKDDSFSGSLALNLNF